MDEAIQQLIKFREQTRAETWVDIVAKNTFIGGITACISVLESAKLDERRTAGK